MLKNLIKNWGLVAVWLVLIAVASSEHFSVRHTGAWLWPIASSCWAGLDRERFQLINLLFRKCGHAAGYLLLCLLIFRGLRASWRDRFTSIVRPAAVALLFTCVVACLDEWHQSATPNRFGSCWDVLLDIGSAAAMQLGLGLILWRRGEYVRSTTETKQRYCDNPVQNS